MRIVAVSDTHRNFKFPIPDGDIFIHAGDIGNFENSNDPFAYDLFLEMLDKLPHKHRLIISGNHDKYLEDHEDEFLEKSKNICTYLKDDSTVIDGICFYGSPWTKYINSDHAFGDQYNKIKRRWDLIHDETDILITHQAPYQIFSQDMDGNDWGCKELQRKIFKLDILISIFGHVHFQGGRCEQIGNTLFYNVAYDKTYNNKCAVVDLNVETKEIEVVDES